MWAASSSEWLPRKAGRSASLLVGMTTSLASPPNATRPDETSFRWHVLHIELAPSNNESVRRRLQLLHWRRDVHWIHRSPPLMGTRQFVQVAGNIMIRVIILLYTALLTDVKTIVIIGLWSTNLHYASLRWLLHRASSPSVCWMSNSEHTSQRTDDCISDTYLNANIIFFCKNIKVKTLGKLNARKNA